MKKIEFMRKIVPSHSNGWRTERRSTGYIFTVPSSPLPEVVWVAARATRPQNRDIAEYAKGDKAWCVYHLESGFQFFDHHATRGGAVADVVAKLSSPKTRRVKNADVLVETPQLWLSERITDKMRRQAIRLLEQS